MEKCKVTATIIKSITAIVCCVAVAVAGNSIVGTICENQNAVAEIIANGGSGNSSSTDDNAYADDSSSPDSSAGVTDDSVTDNAVTDVPGADSENTADDTVGEDVATNKEITVTSGLNSTDKAEILKYYQLVMEKNEKDGLGHNQTMTLTKLDGGSGGVGKFISWFEPVAKRALADNSTSHEGLPGVPDQIKASDFASAKAVNDGRYTTVTIKLVEQTDDAYGKTCEGTVGRTIGVLDGVATALAEINGLEADFQNGELYLHYRNPQVVIKVDNKTGALVKGACSWGYQVYVDIKKLDVSMMGISLTLNGAVGIVDMVSSY